jgi:hypothetical protein
MATMREMACIHLIVDTLRIPFEGDFKNTSDVKQFIYQNYNRAMMVRKQLRDLQDWADTLLLQEAIYKDVEMAEDIKKTQELSDLQVEDQSKQPEEINIRSLRRRRRRS